MLNKIVIFLKSIPSFISEINKKTSYAPTYRISEILQAEDDSYQVRIQLINKNVTFVVNPEEILADDSMVDQFSPRDIRTLTYLGYLGINSPKYKILAQRLSQNNDKLVFALRQKGQDKVIIKTADEIVNEKSILHSLDPKDAHLVGYIAATESIQSEKMYIQSLKKN